MTSSETIGLTVSAVSVVIAIYSAFIAKRSLNKQIRALQWSVNHDLQARARAMLISDPTLLAIHSIDIQDLHQSGVTSQELIYILHHIHAGSAYHLIGGDQNVELTEFRKKFFESSKVRFVWKRFLRNRMFNDAPFTRAIDNHVAKLDNDSAAVSTTTDGKSDALIATA